MPRSTPQRGLNRRKALRKEGRRGRDKRLWRQMMRRQYLAAVGATGDHGPCQRCREWRSDLECHHKIKRSLGGKDVPENALILCSRCHTWAHDTRSPQNLAELRDSPVSVASILTPAQMPF